MPNDLLKKLPKFDNINFGTAQANLVQLHSVSQFWVTISQLWFGFRLKTIFNTAPAASKKYCLIQKWSKIIISLCKSKSVTRSVSKSFLMTFSSLISKVKQFLFSFQTYSPLYSTAFSNFIKWNCDLWNFFWLFKFCPLKTISFQTLSLAFQTLSYKNLFFQTTVSFWTFFISNLLS